MAAKPENNFIANIHKRLNIQVYAEKMYNPLRGGTPDVYYEGKKMLWVEYKFIQLPARDSTLILPQLSDLQILWLKRCHTNTKRARVIVGFKMDKKYYGVVYSSPDEWTESITTRNYKRYAIPIEELVQYIENQTL